MPGEPGCSIIPSGCEPSCGAGLRCVAGECITQGSNCSRAGEACVPDGRVVGGFVCIDWGADETQGAICSPACGPGGACAAGSACYALSTGADRGCRNAADCGGEKLCIEGICRYTACRPSECSGPAHGDAQCREQYAENPNYPRGARCVAGPNQAHFCQPAGDRGAGEDCIDDASAATSLNFVATCAEGLRCVDAICRESCVNAGDCDAPETCILGAPTNSGDELPTGFCTQACEPFKDGACPRDMTCRPISADVGECVPGGAGPAFSRCTPGRGECAAGTHCVSYPNSGEARCHPICDISPAAADGTVPPGAQAARDATCPQPEAAPASIRLGHMAQGLGPVDIYLGSQPTPLVEGLNFNHHHPDPAAPNDATWISLEPGRHRLAALPGGAPRTDLPLAELSVSLGEGEGRTVYVAPGATPGAASAQLVAVSALTAQSRKPGVELRTIHLMAGLGAVDIVILPNTADPSDASTHVLLAENLQFGEATGPDSHTLELPAELLAGPLQILIFSAGTDRQDPEAALLAARDFEVHEDSALILRGDLAEYRPDGAPMISLRPLGVPAPTRGAGITYTCAALPDRAFGFCRQTCDSKDYGQSVCAGEQMGCAPVQIQGRDAWMNLCAPVGQSGPGETCEPGRDEGQCAEGLYCMAVGAATPGAPLTGRCTPLCEVESGDGLAQYTCEMGQRCQPLSYSDGFELGRCGWSCEPGAEYTDPGCPAGLKSCLPRASLQEDPSGQTAPLVQSEQPFCSVSGPLEVGQPCYGMDCAAGSECMYPRSIQTDFTSTLASPYFGGPGLVPVCTPQCDPFDADSAAHTCAPGETCLFNVPWSAEVGHCAPIVEDLRPMQRCAQPGLSCGEDSICTLNQGTPTCFRFCDYRGADARDAFLQSTCPHGFVCEPLVNDIGICQAI